MLMDNVYTKHRIVCIGLLFLSLLLYTVPVKAETVTVERQLHSVPDYSVNDDGTFVYKPYLTQGQGTAPWVGQYYYYKSETIDPRQTTQFYYGYEAVGGSYGEGSNGTFWWLEDAVTGERLTAQRGQEHGQWLDFPTVSGSHTQVRLVIGTGHSWNTEYGCSGYSKITDIRIKEIPQTPCFSGFEAPSDLTVQNRFIDISSYNQDRIRKNIEKRPW